MKKSLEIIIVLIIVALGAWWLSGQKTVAPTTVTSFEECVKADNPVMESYPRQCRHNGENFVEQIENIPPPPVACTADAMICPDGSAVGRTGPKCEFAPCPNTTSNNEVVAKIGQRVTSRGVYITPLKVISDSRCPIDVTCIWAGEVVVKVKLEKNGVSREAEIKGDDKVVFEGSNVLLIGVKPAKKSTKTVEEKDYQFTFRVTGVSSQGKVSGTVTLGPTCPVERFPPDPNCAPKKYQTTINISKSGSTAIFKTIQSNADGYFSVDLNAGEYVFEAEGGNVLPRCSDVPVVVKGSEIFEIQISCDTGIR